MTQASVAATSPLTVLVDGATTPIGAITLAHYTPVVAHRVLVEQVGSQLYIVGKLP